MTWQRLAPMVPWPYLGTRCLGRHWNTFDVSRVFTVENNHAHVPRPEIDTCKIRSARRSCSLMSTSPSGRLRAALASAALTAHVPRPGCIVLPIRAPMAALIPTPGRRWVVASTGMPRVLSDEQLRAVCLHELAHGTQGLNIAGGTCIALAMTFFVSVIWMEPMIPALGEAMLWLGWGWVFVAMLYARRQSEFDADRMAAQWMGSSEALQSALIRVEGPLEAPPAVWRRWLSPHPTLAERLALLRSTPAPCRPQAGLG